METILVNNIAGSKDNHTDLTYAEIALVNIEVGNKEKCTTRM